MFRLFYITLCLFAQLVSAQNVQVPLDDVVWRMREQVEGKKRGADWITADVPGCVHTDLIRAEKIEHPFYGAAETDCQWIEKKSWVYETLPFDVPSGVFSKSNIALRFNGIDTYAKLQLNDVDILTANNAHRSWEVDVKSLLKAQGNVLRIIFDSSVERAQEALRALPYPLPGDSVRAVVRKPQFHFGWDWGPRLVTCGITKPIEWIAYDEARMTDCYFEQISIDEQMAQLHFHAFVASKNASKYTVRVTGVTSGGTWS